jgi:predicted metal-binding protein
MSDSYILSVGTCCAHQYRAKLDGSISYLKCPELLKKRMLAKTPFLPIATLEPSSGL